MASFNVFRMGGNLTKARTGAPLKRAALSLGVRM
jgi:hypothetical protein